jgi:hypothetical protein
MIKLTAGQASAFNSPVIAKLFADNSRTFPYGDALKLSDMVQQCQEKIKAYGEQVRKIVEDNNGTFNNPSGQIVYETMTDRQKADAAIADLDKTELEITGTPLKPTAAWPNLTIIEATILKPLLEKEG